MRFFCDVAKEWPVFSRLHARECFDGVGNFNYNSYA